MKLFEKFFDRPVFKTGFIFICRIVAALLGIVLLPIYIKLLGVESYGLVAFYATISGALMVLTAGLSSSVGREVSFLSARCSPAERIVNLVFSVEVIGWAVAIFLGISLVCFANIVANYWIRADELDVNTIRYSVILMGLVFVFQLPASIYEGCLTGLHKQVEFAFINMLFSVIKSVGVIIVLKYIKTDIVNYFLWQLLITLLLSLVLRVVVYRLINPENLGKKYSRKQIGQIKKFALGMTGISVVTFFISQIDKLVVSKLLLLKYVGYYNIAFALSGILMMIASPIHTIVGPKLNMLEAQSKTNELRDLYYKTNRWVVVLVAPIGLALVVFAHDILLLWTKNVELANETAPVLRFVALGYIFNAIATTFYFYTLAKGNTRFGLLQNLFSVVIILPLIIILTKRFGAVGAGACWFIYNTLLILVSLPFFHKFYLKNEFFYWVKNVFAYPIIASCLLMVCIKLLQLRFFPSITIINISFAILVAFAFYVLVVRDTRIALFSQFKKYFNN